MAAAKKKKPTGFVPFKKGQTPPVGKAAKRKKK